MSRTRSAALAALSLLLLPTLLVVSPAAVAEDVVPFAPAVPYVPQVGFRHTLYLTFEDAAPGQPDCGTAVLSYSPASDAGQTPRAPCNYPTSGSGTGATPLGDPLGSVRTFEGMTLRRSFNVSGADSLQFTLAGSVPSGATLDAEVYSGTNLIGTARFVGPLPNDDEGSPMTRDVVLDSGDGTGLFEQGKPIKVMLRPTVASAGDGTPATPSTYSVDDTGTSLSILSRDAIRVATWIGEPKSTSPKPLWRPLTNLTPLAEAPRMQFYFSVQSAFPGDASSAPVFTVTRGTDRQPLTPSGGTQLTGQRNTSLVDTDAGITTWTLRPGETVDYRGRPAGEYVLRARSEHQQGDDYTEGVTMPFLISAQGVKIEPFTETDRTLNVAPETTGHEVPPGGSTTYLLNVTNTGSANDTFRIDASFVTGSPGSGWSSVVDGPAVRNRRVDLAPNASELITVTVTAPVGAPIGSSSIFRVNATSTVDPTAVSPTLTLSTSVANPTARRDVGIVVPQIPELPAGVDTEISVYVWNRAMRPGNISLDLQENPVAGWTADLLQGGLPVQRVVLSNVPAGGIAEATLRVSGPANQVPKTYGATLNATSQDATGYAVDRPIRFSLRSGGGISVQILESIGSLGHVAEIQGGSSTIQGPAGDPLPNPQCAPQNPPDGPANICFKDNASGVWFRVWVTNTGKITEDVSLRLDSVSWAANAQCSDAAFVPHETTGTSAFRFYARSAAGRTREVDTIPSLEPGRTAEVYVWRPVVGSAALCTSDDFLSFVVVARGLASGTVGTASARASAENTGGRQAVLVEPVARPDAGRSNEIRPLLVDITNASRRSLTGTVEVNKSTTYRVRVTNGASWATHVAPDGKLREPRVNVFAEGAVAREAGWNVSVRPILDPVDGPTVGVANYSFTNEVGGRPEAWRDLEFEVNVTAPSAANGTALAGTSAYFSLRADMPGYGTFSTLEIVTTVAKFADVAVKPDRETLSAHPGEAAPALLLVQNLGGAEANVSLRASIDPSTQNAAQWRVEPAFQNFRVSAFHNRSVALLVTPPPGAGAGTTTTLNVLVEYAPTSKGNFTLRVPVTVFGPGTLDVSSPVTDTTIAPGGFANFTIAVRNRGNLPVEYELTTTDLPHWDTSLSAPKGNLQPLETVNVAYVLRAPAAVEDNARFASVVRVVEDGNDNNFDAQALGINILGGKAFPALSAPVLQKRVDRGGVQHFALEVRNTGNAVGTIPLEVRSADPAWVVGIQDETGASVTQARLNPNELRVFNVTVRAPAVVPERSSVLIDVTASTPDFTQQNKITFRAEIHDYGVSIAVSPSRIDAAPGVETELVVRVRNLGNDNDTLNLSSHLVDLPGWNVSLSDYDVPLEPGQEGEVRAVVKSPTDPLPSARTYTFRLFVGTIGGLGVNLPRNESAVASVAILPYRALDVDDDERLEVAVDADGRASNGYERFQEVALDQTQTVLVAASLFDGKTRFFLDVPEGGSPDGIADVWFDPESVFAYDIAHAPDLNDDGTPEYLVDTDRDAKIDHAYDTATDTYWSATEVKALGDDRVQYVVDTTLDGKPDYYYDPAPDRTTRVQAVSGQGTNVVGLDTDGDGEVDKYYNYRTNAVSGVTAAKASGFVTKYWYFFALFALVLVATIVLLVRRARS